MEEGSALLLQLGEGVDNPVDVGGGRILPTTSWESMWAPIAEWMGVGPADMDSVLPNRANFLPTSVLSKTDVYKN